MIELTPGPNMAWLAMLAATEGRRLGLAAAAGTTIGLALNGILAAAGLSVLLTTEPWLWTALRWAGAGLMLWLAAEAWIGGSGKGMAVASHYGVGHYLGMGALINLLNPKAFIFYILIAPPFLPDGKLGFTVALKLMAISVTIATIIHLILVLLGSAAHRWLSDPTKTRLVRRLLALMLLGVAGWFLFSTSRPGA